MTVTRPYPPMHINLELTESPTLALSMEAVSGRITKSCEIEFYYTPKPGLVPLTPKLM